jgi:hypothetical protein
MPTKPSLAYQPFLLRILHGFTALFVIAAILTAFWTYDVYIGYLKESLITVGIMLTSFHGW